MLYYNCSPRNTDLRLIDFNRLFLESFMESENDDLDKQLGSDCRRSNSNDPLTPDTLTKVFMGTDY